MGILNRTDGSVRYEGCVLATHNTAIGFDHYDTGYFATVWDEAEGKVAVVMYDSTYPVPDRDRKECVVDAGIEVRMKAVEADLPEAIERIRWAERHQWEEAVIGAHRVRRGSRVLVTKGRKVPVGAEGVVVWTGEGNYGPRVGFIPDAYPEGGAVFLALSNVVAIDVDAPALDEFRRPDAEVESAALLDLARKYGVPEGVAVEAHREAIRAAVRKVTDTLCSKCGERFVTDSAVNDICLDCIEPEPPQHKSALGFDYGTPHDSDCPACVKADAERAAGRTNPHRPGTKAAAQWERLNNAGLAACDPRTETYWSM